MKGDKVDTTNKFFVALLGTQVMIGNPRGRMTKREALGLAAWLVALAEDEPGEFNEVLEAVRTS